ncbi:hypothetical protein MHYP_G00165660 [Metynnis hypsauchen]
MFIDTGSSPQRGVVGSTDDPFPTAPLPDQVDKPRSPLRNNEDQQSHQRLGKAVTPVLAGGMLYLAGWDIHPAPSAQITHGSGTFHSGAPALLGL